MYSQHRKNVLRHAIFVIAQSSFIHVRNTRGYIKSPQTITLSRNIVAMYHQQCSVVSCDEDSLRLWNLLPLSQFASVKLAAILPSREILCALFVLTELQLLRCDIWSQSSSVSLLTASTAQTLCKQRGSVQHYLNPIYMYCRHPSTFDRVEHCLIPILCIEANPVCKS